jgi:hypothetical protein
VRDVRANVAWSYLFNRRLSTTLALSASSLQGVGQVSPLTRQSSALSGVLGVGYTFQPAATGGPGSGRCRPTSVESDSSRSAA